jgi:hypothetical protein
MDTSERREKSGRVQLRVAARLLESEKAEKVPTSVAYAFTSGGHLLAQEILDKDGTAELYLPTAQVARSVRVMIGPELDEKEIGIPELQRRGAVGRMLRIDADDLAPNLEVAIIPDDWLCWLIGLCYVQGTVLKREILGGAPIDLPVCNATVEIYEIDPIPLVVARLPDDIIEKFREIIIDPPPPGPFPPEPPEGPIPPPPPPGPFPPPPPEARFMTSSLAALGEAMESALPVSREAPMARASVGDLQFMARTATTSQFRNVLAGYPDLVQVILCRFFPIAVTKSLVATATTNDCGHFQAWFSRGCHSTDTPDLYFKVKQRILPHPFPPITIYAPTPVSCYTYWNYDCGSEVTLHVTHPLTITCSPCPPVIAPNNWVLVWGIGNKPSNEIRGTSTDLAATTNAANIGTTDSGKVFGGTLRLRLDFDNSLRDDLGVEYYQVSYRAGNSGPFTPLTRSVDRYTTREVGGDLVVEVYNLGPKPIGPNLFEIPPALPGGGRQWTIPSGKIKEATTSAEFNTLDLGGLVAPGASWPQHGKYQLKVDLYDSAGNLVDIDALNIKYRVPTEIDGTGTIHTGDAAAAPLNLVYDDDGDSKKSFIMTVHVDNSRCKAEILPPLLGGIAADAACGVLRYDPASPGTVTMRYRPSYANGIGSDAFANYTFRVKRGVDQLGVVIPLPHNPDALSVPDIAAVPLPNVDIHNGETVDDLRGSCDVAGFSQTLYVNARTTDGWQDIDPYDSFDHAAFVLAPQEDS